MVFYVLIDTSSYIIDPVAPMPSTKEIRAVFNTFLSGK